MIAAFSTNTESQNPGSLAIGVECAVTSKNQRKTEIMNTKAVMGMVVACLSIAAVVNASVPPPVNDRADRQAIARVNHEVSQAQNSLYSRPRNPGRHQLIGS
jgi:hypothetical protein